MIYLCGGPWGEELPLESYNIAKLRWLYGRNSGNRFELKYSIPAVALPSLLDLLPHRSKRSTIPFGSTSTMARRAHQRLRRARSVETPRIAWAPSAAARWPAVAGSFWFLPWRLRHRSSVVFSVFVLCCFSSTTHMSLAQLLSLLLPSLSSLLYITYAYHKYISYYYSCSSV